MPNEAPEQIDGARVILSTKIDERHRPTEKCRHTVAGNVLGAASGLAICQYAGESSFYLFYCDDNWECVTDTWHQTLDDAMHQAEFEYEGVSKTLCRHVYDNRS